MVFNYTDNQLNNLTQDFVIYMVMKSFQVEKGEKLK